VTATAIIVGAGPAGLAAACLLAHDNIATTVIAPESATDHRTTALMDPSIRMLKYLNLWPGEIAQYCSPLKHLHIVDDTGNTVSAPKLEFAATELGLEAFGYNVPLAHLIPALRNRAIELGVTFVTAQALSFEHTGDHVTIAASDGSNHTARIILAADGANSVVRNAAKIEIETTTFDQAALATSFAHSAPHDFISTEFHKAAGPFTIVPLPGNRSSLVWMDLPDRIASLKAMPDADLATEIQLETKGLLGRISEIGSRASYAMRSQRAKTFAANRVMLIGESAHQLPPIGAQGLNMSLRDAAQAVDLILLAEDPGADSVLAEYNSLRQADTIPRSLVVTWMNHSLLSTMLPATLARVAALTAASMIPALRQRIMQQGLSPTSNLPFAMRTR
jgi:2-octaprenyl-6-methoxyphenol hydroxylase